MNFRIINIIKAQINYTVYNLYGTVIIFTCIFIYSHFREFNPVNLLSFIFFMQYAALALLSSSKESREITFRLLTIPAREIAILRILLVIVGFVVIYGVSLGLNVIIFHPGNDFRDGYHELFMFGGIGLFGIFLYLLFSDYITVFKTSLGYIWFNVISGILIGIIGFGIILSTKSTFENSVGSSTILIAFIYICSAIFAIISFFTYQNRESYMGYK